MSGLFALFLREKRAYLQSPIAVIVVVSFLLFSGGLFMNQFLLFPQMDMRFFFALLPYLLAVVVPALSMRLWAEDRQLNTLELLMSLPLRPSALVLGKYLAALCFLGLLLASTWTIPLALRLSGRPDFGPILTGYIGSFLLGALFLAVGQFISGFCREQIAAFILALFACLGLFLIGTDFIAASIDGWWPGLGGFLQRTLGVARHYAGFERGIVDGQALLYFLLLIAAFLSLNGMWLGGRLRPCAKAAFALSCALALGAALAAQAVLQYLPIGRLDRTSQKLYTISDATRKLLAELEVPVTVKLYLSPAEKMPTGLRTMERSLRDSLEEMRMASGGKLAYKVFHPEAVAALAEPEKGPAPEAGEESPESGLTRRGIHPFQVRSIEADEVGVKLIYAAASIAYKDRPEEIIPQVVPEILDRWEYIVASKIHRLTQEEPASVALVAPFDEKTVPPELKAILGQMGRQVPDQVRDDPYRYLPEVLEQEGYRVSRIRLTEEEPVPAGTRTLVLVDPVELNERQRYEISRCLVEGGSLFIAAQRYRFNYVRQPRGVVPLPQEKKLGLDGLLESWGLQIGREILLDEESRIITAEAESGVGPFSVTFPVKSPVQVIVRKEQMNPGLNLTGQLPSLFYMGGSPLVVREGELRQAGLKAATLFTSSPRSWTVPMPQFVDSPLQPPRQRTGRFPLAVWVQGAFADPFDGKPVPAWPKAAEGEAAPGTEPEAPKPEEPPGPPSSLTGKPGQLILVGCSEMFTEQLAGTPGHLAFFLNAVDTLASGGKLVGIRNKQAFSLPVALPSPAKRAGLRFLTLGLMPILLVAASLLHAAWRRHLREAALS